MPRGVERGYPTLTLIQEKAPLCCCVGRILVSAHFFLLLAHPHITSYNIYHLETHMSKSS